MKACGARLAKGLARNWKIRLFVLWFCFPFACTSPDSPSFDDGACTIDPVQVTESDAGLSPNALPFKSAVTWKCDHDLAYQVSQFIITVQCGDYTQEYSKHIHYLLPHMEATTFNYDLEKNFLVPCFANCQLVVKSFNRSRVLVYAANASFTTPKTAPLQPPVIDRVDFENETFAVVHWKASSSTTCGQIKVVQLRFSSDETFSIEDDVGESGLKSPSVFNLDRLSANPTEKNSRFNVTLRVFNDVSSSQWSDWFSTTSAYSQVTSTKTQVIKDNTADVPSMWIPFAVAVVLCISTISIFVFIIVIRKKKKQNPERRPESMDIEHNSVCTESQGRDTQYDTASVLDKELKDQISKKSYSHETLDSEKNSASNLLSY